MSTAPDSTSTSASTTKSLTIGEVAEGTELSQLSYEVSATTVVLGALAARDWRPMHHDYDFAVNRNGVENIFVNTPNLAAWFERYLTDWSGPKGRPGRMKFRMRGSIFPGHTMVFNGKVRSVETDDTDCAWATVDIAVSVDGDVKTSCEARIALPADENDNPWSRQGDNWKP